MLANRVRMSKIYIEPPQEITLHNIILNGNFTDTSSWTSSNISEFSLTTDNNIGYVISLFNFFQAITLTANSQYYLSAWIKTFDEDNYFYSFSLDGVNSLPYGSLIETSEWQRIILKGTYAGTGNSQFIITSEDMMDFEIRDVVLVDKTADDATQISDVNMATHTQTWFNTKNV